MRLLMRRTAITLAALAIACAGLTTSVAPARAAGDNGSFAVQPTSAAGSTIPRQYFVYTLPAGQTVRDSVTISNLTAGPKTFSIYGADGFTTPTDGALGFAAENDPQRGVGAWIDMSRRTLTLPPHARVDVPFTMTVPLAAAPGDHVGGVVVLDQAVTPSASTGNGASIGIRQAIAARVYLRVNGPTHARLQVSGVSLDRRHRVVHYQLINEGNVRLGPDVRVTVSGLLNGGVASSTTKLSADLLPGSHAEYSVRVAQLPSVDYLTVRVQASSDQANATGSTTVLLLPWWVLTVAAVVLALLAGGLGWLVIRRRRRGAARAADPEEVTV